MSEIIGTEKRIEMIRDGISTRSALEGLAEEASELSQAALKLIRAAGLSHNKTSASMSEAMINLKEEIQDVLMYIAILKIDVPDVKYNPKWERWSERMGK